MESEFHKIQDEILSNPILEYNVSIGFESTRLIAEAIEREMEGRIPDKAHRIIYHVAIELLQSSDRYSVQDKKLKFAVSIKEGNAFVFYQNYMHASELQKLKTDIETSNSLVGNKEELKRLYKKIIKEGSYNNKSSMGIGLIDMIRKTKNKLRYHFSDSENDTCIFSCISTISIL